MDIFAYKKKRYLIEQTITNLFAFLFALISLYFIVNQIFPVIMSLGFISSIYAVFNNFVFKVNSRKISISDRIISFEAYNKVDFYTISDIKSFKIKEFPSSGKIYLRIKNYDNKNSRYWIHTGSFDDGKKLFKSLLDIEYIKHPEGLKAKARSSSSLNKETKENPQEAANV